MKKIIFLSTAWLLAISMQAQSIRKDYREFTAQELNDYMNVVQQLGQNFVIADYTSNYAQTICANIHSTDGTTCHPAQYGEYYLPWHRVLLQDFEYQLKQWSPATSYLTVPYWDWTVDNNIGIPHFWDNTFLAEANFAPDLSITRCLGSGSCSGATLPTAADVNALLGLTTYYQPGVGPPQLTATDFTHRLEALKNQVNGWVGPTQGNLYTATDDPAFFLNQAMVDKLWQEWEDNAPGQQTGLPHGSWYMSATRPGSQNVIADQVYDSRKIPFSNTGGRANDVWYASQGKVLLDGSDGNDFVASDVNAPYLYRYTTSVSTGSAGVGGGAIYVGDVQRNGNSVIADTKGGFRIDPNVQCDFRAGAAIVFLPGYEASKGATSVAKIISAPNGLTPGNPGGEVDPRETSLAQKSVPMPSGLALKCFPNPVVDFATFEYTLVAAAEVELKILDMTGKTIQLFSIGEQTKGTHQFNWETGSIPKGLYFCNLSAAGQKQTLKLVVN